MDPNTEICVTCGGTEAMMAAVPGSSFFKEPVNHLIRMHFARGTGNLYKRIHRFVYHLISHYSFILESLSIKSSKIFLTVG